VAGQKAYVDDNGLHIGDQNQPANAIANQVAAQALSQGGFEIYVSAPRYEQKGAEASYNTGSLIVQWKPQGSQSVFTYVLGNSRVAVSGAIGDPSLAALTDTSSTDTGFSSVAPVAETTAPGAATSPGGSVPGATPVEAAPSDTGTVAAAPAAAPQSGGASIATVPATSSSSPFGGVSAGWVLAGLAGAGLLAAGFRRATDDILERAATACPLER
jgi:hypothetical protein